VSARRLQGWEPAETTTYEYDDAGRVISATTTREPEWDREQLAMMLAHIENEASIDSLGFPIAESTSPDGDENNKQGKYLYRAEKPIVNFAARAQENAQEAYRKAHGGELPSYLHFPVKRYERPRS